MTNECKCSCSCGLSSLGKKYLMAITGFAMVLFVLVHMVGNLNMFVGPDAMNHYAHFLQTLPYGLLWVFRVGLFVVVLVHVMMAISLTRGNSTARPIENSVKAKMGTSCSSAIMGVTGSFLLFFIVFHIAHFTLRIVFPEYQSKDFFTTLNGSEVYNVYKMVLSGFSHLWVTILYVVSMALLCSHLSHGVSSMFQTLGWRNKHWKNCLDKFALLYGWVIFLGFISVPVAVVLSKYKVVTIFAELASK